VVVRYEGQMIAQLLLDELWDFDDPAGSERRLADAAADGGFSAGERAELMTQLARALGLQQRFDDALAVLESLRDDTDPVVRARIALEAGRLRNSAGESRQASVEFESALALARAAGHGFLEIDALHMLAIADADHGDEWARRGIAAAERATDGRTRRWLVSLYNNLGWRRFDRGEFDAALEDFQAVARWAGELGTAEQRQWAAEAIAECEAAIAARAAAGLAAP
jgi:tetratricopeptide (TPR) repeat protein